MSDLDELKAFAGKGKVLRTWIADANGDPTEPWEGFETLFGDGELFKHLELGWYSTWELVFYLAVRDPEDYASFNRST